MKNADNILRVGGVGTGRIFQSAHTRVYPQFLDTAWLTGFFDLDPQRAQQARDKYEGMLRAHIEENPSSKDAAEANLAELRCYGSLKELLDDVDVVDVATYAKGRMDTAVAAMERGVHVMTQKPMARIWTEADRAARVAASHPDVVFQLNDDNVYDPKYRTLNALLQQGTIGKPQNMLLIRGCQLDATSTLKAQANAMYNGGGALMDYGSHGMAGAWSALGRNLKPVKVEAVKIGVFYPNRVLEGDPYLMEVDDRAQIKVLLEDPETGSWVTVFLEATWSGGTIGMDPVKHGGQTQGYFRVIGDKGVITTNSATAVTVRHWDGGERVVPLKEYPGETIAFEAEYINFFNCLRTGTRSETDVNFGADVMAICGTAYLSAIRKQAVTLDEFKAYCRGYVEKYGDNQQADEAIILDLLAPYKKQS